MRLTTDRWMAVLIFGLLFGVYATVAGGHAYSSDEEGLFATTKALVERRAVEVPVTEDNNEVLPLRPGRTGAPVVVGGLGQSLVAVPFYLTGSVLGQGISGPTYRDYPERLFVGWVNVVVTALIGAVLFLVARDLGASAPGGLLLSLTYGFATFAFAHAKTFFSEPLATLFVLLAVATAIRARRSPTVARAAGVGALLGVGLFARATVVIFVPVIGAYLVWAFARERGFLRGALAAGAGLAGGAAVPVGLFLLSNWWRFGSATDLGYGGVRFTYPVHEGLYGLFLSPGKSVFLYAPVVAVGFAALVAVPRERRAEAGLLAVLGMTNALFFSRFIHWHGDHSWGPRYLSMSVPLWVLIAAPVVDRVPWRRAVWVTAGLGFASALLGVSMYFNQYFRVVAVEKGEEILPDGPAYWKEMHFDPYWAPIPGTVRALPHVVRNTVNRLGGRERPSPYPFQTNDRYGWYFSPPQVDLWSYWILMSRGPHRFLLLAPAFPAVAVASAWGLRRALRTSPAAVPTGSHDGA